MEPSKDPIALRLSRLNRQILGKVTSGSNSFSNKRTIDREALFDALTVLYDECNDDPIKKCDELVRAFVDKYRSTLAELRRTRVCIADFETLQIIGRGYFADVHMVREKQTGDVYALKTLRKEEASKRAPVAAEDERDVLAASTGSWLPKLQYAFQDNSNLYLVMELCPGGDLANMLSRREHPLCERDAAFYVAEVAHALRALHNMGFVHRDVKPHNILLDRCGHVKLGDFGSCARLSEGVMTSLPAATADYLAPELLAAAACAQRHSVCSACCRGQPPPSITACDYWSLGVVAFELVTLTRPFSSGDDDTMAQILNNIQEYEREENPTPPFPPLPEAPSEQWRSLVAGLLNVRATKRFAYLDTLQHAALRHLSPHSIRDQAPPWVPSLRGPEDASHFSTPERAPAAPRSQPFRARAPFAGQLPFVGFSYVAPDESDDTMSTGFNASHDCTAIDLATFKSAEKLAAMRGREIASLQTKLAQAEATTTAEAEKTRRAAEDEAERQRARLQAEITALSLQNKRLERQIEIDKEERMALERNIQELSSVSRDRSTAELRKSQSLVSELECERDMLKEEQQRLVSKIEELTSQCDRNMAAAESARAQQRHYKDSIAKERALRRQTLSGCEADSREITARLAAAEAAVAKETRAREEVERKLASADLAARTALIEVDDAKRELEKVKEALNDKKRLSEASTEELKQVQLQLTNERLKSSTLQAQVMELQRSLEEVHRREKAVEEQCERTEMRLQERLREAEDRTAEAVRENARHREKVATLEQFVRQLEREVGALEARGGGRGAPDSDTESVGDVACAQVALLKEQLAKAEAQIQSRTEEMAALRQEARAANLARWRKEREYNDLTIEAKTKSRELKRLEERLSSVSEMRKVAEQKASALKDEVDTFKPDLEKYKTDFQETKEALERITKEHEVLQTEVDRSRNDILKLKCELQYSEKRRIRAEELEEIGSRERGQLRDEAQEARAEAQNLQLNNRALQDACNLLEEQLTDLERLSDLHEQKNKDLEKEIQSLTSELCACKLKLSEAERVSAERSARAANAERLYDVAQEQAAGALQQIQTLKDRLDSRETRLCELESLVGALEQDKATLQAALSRSHKQTAALQEESSLLRTRAQEHHARAMQLQAQLDTAHEEIAAIKEASDSAAAWWRTRETKADATLRQQAKLIDFLQCKVEDTKLKKCSLSNKLFGRSPRTPARLASPPLRRANRELREEVDRLKRKLAAVSGGSYPSSDVPPTTPCADATPRRHTTKSVNGVLNIDTPDGVQNENLQLLYKDGTTAQVKNPRVVDGWLVFTNDGRELRARFLTIETSNLPHNEAQRAFTIKFDTPDLSEATVICASVEQRSRLVTALPPPPLAPGYSPAELARCPDVVFGALYVASDAVVLRTSTGLQSLRGALRVECEGETAPPTALAACGARVLTVTGRRVLHVSLAGLVSASRRAACLRPVLQGKPLALADCTPPVLLQPISGEVGTGPCLAVAANRRVFLLRYDAAATDFKLARSLTVDRPPYSLLLTDRALFIAGERPLKIKLPSGALESFAMEVPTVSAAAKKHSPPKQLLLIRDNPLEVLICYAECGVFVGENGKRTRTDDPKWQTTITDWAYVAPFLYLVSDDSVTILSITEDSYRAPACTCDTDSFTSSDCYTPEHKFVLKLNDVTLLGTAPNGIMVRSQIGCQYVVSVVEGMAAFRSVGASLESLATASDAQGSTVSLAQSQSLSDSPSSDLTSESSRDTSERESLESNEAPTAFLADIRHKEKKSFENNDAPISFLADSRQKEKNSFEGNDAPTSFLADIRQKEKKSFEGNDAPTSFLADIRQKAEQLRRNTKKATPNDVIRAVMTTEIDIKRVSRGRSPPSTISEESSDESSKPNTIKSPADICAEMFTKQVKFQKN